MYPVSRQEGEKIKFEPRVLTLNRDSMQEPQTKSEEGAGRCLQRSRRRMEHWRTFYATKVRCVENCQAPMGNLSAYFTFLLAFAFGNSESEIDSAETALSFCAKHPELLGSVVGTLRVACLDANWFTRLRTSQKQMKHL
jgi:hypothetical protein